MTTVTVTLTKEIGIYFHGKRIPTHILDTEVQVQTATSTLSRVVEITPTPTWQTITITPAVTLPPPPPAPPVPDISLLLARQRQEQDRNLFLEQLHRQEQPRSFGGFKAHVIELPQPDNGFESVKKYLENIRRLELEQHPKIVAEPHIALPSTSISTVYLSGSVPGQYSTSLVTLNLDENGNPLVRRRRNTSPSLLQPVVATRLAKVEEINIVNHSEVNLVGSFVGESVPVPGVDRIVAGELCTGQILTVTVTVTRTYLP